MKWTKELEEQLTKVLKSLDGDIERNPQMRYWGGPIEEYYELICAKKNAAIDVSCALAGGCEGGWEKLPPEEMGIFEKFVAQEVMYRKIQDLLRSRYPHIKKWSAEMFGCGSMKVC